jgi:zinc transport system substrate-binding protein
MFERAIPNQKWHFANGRAHAALLLAGLLCLVCGCREKPEATPTVKSTGDSAKPLIIAVSYPLEYLTQRIVGDFAEVRCPVPDGQSASEWKPNRDEILEIQSADMIVANGVGARFAKWLEMTSLPANKICNSATRGLALRDFIEIEDVRYTHSHGSEGEHSHATNCAYTWLNPEMAQKQAKYIADDLSKRFPERVEEFSKRYGELAADLKKLQAAFDNLSPGNAVIAVVITSNPDLKFFTKACGWEDIHLKWFEPPTDKDAAEDLQGKLESVGNRTLIARNGKSLMLSTYEFPDNIKKFLESKGIAVAVIDKMDVRPVLGDYLSVMNENLRQLE